MGQCASRTIERIRIAMSTGVECHVDICATTHPPKPKRTNAGPVAERFFKLIVYGLPVHVVRQIHYLVGQIKSFPSTA